MVFDQEKKLFSTFSIVHFIYFALVFFNAGYDGLRSAHWVVQNDCSERTTVSDGSNQADYILTMSFRFGAKSQFFFIIIIFRRIQVKLVLYNLLFQCFELLDLEEEQQK